MVACFTVVNGRPAAEWSKNSDYVCGSYDNSHKHRQCPLTSRRANRSPASKNGRAGTENFHLN